MLVFNYRYIVFADDRDTVDSFKWWTIDAWHIISKFDMNTLDDRLVSTPI